MASPILMITPDFDRQLNKKVPICMMCSKIWMVWCHVNKSALHIWKDQNGFQPSSTWETRICQARAALLENCTATFPKHLYVKLLLCILILMRFCHFNHTISNIESILNFFSYIWQIGSKSIYCQSVSDTRFFWNKDPLIKDLLR